MSATPAPGRTHDLTRLLDDAERWANWAARMNAKALAAGLVTADELTRDRQVAQAARDQLSARLGGTP